MGLTLGQGEDARAEELHNLRVALATFALQLDAFEMRANSALLAARRAASMRETSTRKASIAVPWTDRKRGTEGEK
jgi:hypothetical protein